jgi:fatty-acyl-CoA synthase
MPGAVDWLARRAELDPDRLALICAETGRRLGYGEWNQRADTVARFLSVSLGIRRGDRVTVLSPNRLEYLDVFFACGKLGAVLHNPNWRLAPPELEQVIQHAAPAAILYDDELAERAAWLRVDARRVPLAALSDLPPAAAPPPPTLGADDPWVICYTGGSTGTPKGVILTHGTITQNAVNTAAGWELRPDDVALLDAPLFHTGGLNVFTTPLVHVGGASILCRRFEPERALDRLASGEVSLYFGVPTMFVRLQEHERFAGADLSRVRLLIGGGAPAPPRLFERFFAKGIPFRMGYGLTEAGPNNFRMPTELAWTKPGSVGFPLDNVETRLVDEAGALVDQPDRVGELCLRGPHVTPGYFRDPQATAAVLSPDGWLRTGDLARRDADGCTTIVGRSKEMYISGGENVYPAEVEGALAAHPAVVEAAVVGIPDEIWGEVGRAVVVVRPGARLEEAELARHLRARLAGYKVPKRIDFVEELPRTGAGKIDRRALT